jgi:hypothetical protein
MTSRIRRLRPKVGLGTAGVGTLFKDQKHFGYREIGLSYAGGPEEGGFLLKIVL